MSEWRPTCGEFDESPAIAGTVICRKKLFGGTPSLGTCNGCDLNPAKGKMPKMAAAPPHVPTPAEIAAAKVAEEARNVVFRGLWREIHLAALSPAGLTEAKLADVLGRMPCGPCKTHFNQLRDGEPLPARFETTVGWHNAVNAALGKPLMKADEAREAVNWQL